MTQAQYERIADDAIEDASYWKKAAKNASGRCLILSKQRDEFLEALEGLLSIAPWMPPSDAPVTEGLAATPEYQKVIKARAVIAKARGQS